MRWPPGYILLRNVQIFLTEKPTRFTMFKDNFEKLGGLRLFEIYFFRSKKYLRAVSGGMIFPKLRRGFCTHTFLMYCFGFVCAEFHPQILRPVGRTVFRLSRYTLYQKVAANFLLLFHFERKFNQNRRCEIVLWDP